MITDKGINCIIEKPMAMSIEDADKNIALAEERGVKVSACHQNRFNIAIQELRKDTRSGTFWTVIAWIHQCPLEPEPRLL